MAVRNLAWYISLAISFFGCLAIEFFFTGKPTQSINHANTAVVPIVLLIPFLLLSLFITWTVGRKYFAIRPLRRPGILLIAIIIILVIGITGEYQTIQETINGFEKKGKTIMSVLKHQSYFNYFTVNWYFNENSFLLVHLISFCLGFVGRKNEWQLEIEEKEYKAKNE